LIFLEIKKVFIFEHLLFAFDTTLLLVSDHVICNNCRTNK
jgi:hypothetical protein